MKFLEVLKNNGAKLIKAGSQKSNVVMGVAAIGGLVGSVVLAYIARPKVDRIMDEQRRKVEDLDADESLTEEERKKERRHITRETVKRLTPVMLPTVACTIASGTMMAGSIVTGEKKIRKMGDLALAGDVAYTELLNATKEVVGEEKAEEIQKKAAENKLEKELSDEDILHPGEPVDADRFMSMFVQARGGKQPFYYAMTGRLFLSDVQTIDHVCTYLSTKIASGAEAYISENDFWTEMELDQVGGGGDRAFGGMSSVQKLQPNMRNTMRYGDISVIILDWYDRPTTRY